MNYNIPDPTGKPAFKLNVNMIESAPNRRRRRRYVDGTTTENLVPTADNYMVTMEVCTRSAQSLMVFLSVFFKCFLGVVLQMYPVPPYQLFKLTVKEFDQNFVWLMMA